MMQLLLDAPLQVKLVVQIPLRLILFSAWSINICEITKISKRI